MHPLLLCVGLVSLTASAAPTCKQRVASLTALAAQLEVHRGSWATGPMEVTFDGYRSPKRAVEQDDWKKRGVRLQATLDVVLDEKQEASLGRELTDLAGAAKVELCVAQGAPVEQKLSLEADAKLLAPLLAEVRAAPAVDRATLLAAHVEHEKWSCQLIPQSFEAVAYVAPSDRLGIVARSVAESLTECGCPAAEAERIFALLSLMADVWADKEVCAPIVIGKPPKAKAVSLKGPVMNLVSALQAAGVDGVTLPLPAPKKEGR